MYTQEKGIIMTTWLNNLFPPVTQTAPVEWGSGAKKVGGVQPTTFSPTEAGIAGINGEVSPKYLDTATNGSVYKNGLGHSNFTFNCLG